MEKSVSDLLTNNVLEKACSFWDCNSINLKLLGEVENFVYEHIGNNNFILRITHSSHRSESLVKAELEWLAFLSEKNINVCQPIKSINNNLIEIINLDNSYFIICVFEKAKGKILSYKNHDYDDTQIMYKLGGITGKLHHITKNYIPVNLRQEWFEEDNIANAKKYLPLKSKVLNELDSLVKYFKNLTPDKDSYGLIHSDIHSGNFFVDNEKITLFDFDDSCYHWYIFDIATVIYSRLLSIDDKQRDTRADQLLNYFIEGYYKENYLDKKWFNFIPAMFRLREILIYVFLNKKWDLDNLNESNQKFFDQLKNRIDNNIPIAEFKNLNFK